MLDILPKPLPLSSFALHNLEWKMRNEFMHVWALRRREKNKHTHTHLHSHQHLCSKHIWGTHTRSDRETNTPHSKRESDLSCVCLHAKYRFHIRFAMVELWRIFWFVVQPLRIRMPQADKWHMHNVHQVWRRRTRLHSIFCTSYTYSIFIFPHSTTPLQSVFSQRVSQFYPFS